MNSEPLSDRICIGIRRQTSWLKAEVAILPERSPFDCLPVSGNCMAETGFQSVLLRESLFIRLNVINRFREFCVGGVIGDRLGLPFAAEEGGVWFCLDWLRRKRYIERKRGPIRQGQFENRFRLEGEFLRLSSK